MKNNFEIKYFNEEYVRELHDKYVLKNGIEGLMGIKDKGLLESILFNIQNDLYYPDFVDKLTHLVFCIVKFHIFNDGNKRTAIACSAYFLLINGYGFLINDYIREMENICIWVAENKVDKEFLKIILNDLINYSEITYEIKLRLIEFLDK